MPDLPSRELVEKSVRHNMNASLVEQIIGLETEKALLGEQLRQAQEQSAKLGSLVKALQAELQKRRPAPAIEPVSETAAAE